MHFDESIKRKLVPGNPDSFHMPRRPARERCRVNADRSISPADQATEFMEHQQQQIDACGSSRRDPASEARETAAGESGEDQPGQGRHDAGQGRDRDTDLAGGGAARTRTKSDEAAEGQGSRDGPEPEVSRSTL